MQYLYYRVNQLQNDWFPQKNTLRHRLHWLHSNCSKIGTAIGRQTLNNLYINMYSVAHVSPCQCRVFQFSHLWGYISNREIVLIARQLTIGFWYNATIYAKNESIMQEYDNNVTIQTWITHSMTVAVGGQYTGCHCASSYTDHSTPLCARLLLALTVWRCVSLLISSASDDAVAQIAITDAVMPRRTTES